MSRVAADIVRTSFPAMSGAAMMAQRLKWARYSSSVMPPFPTSSMSGSFHAPGRATLACCDERSSRESMEDHLSRMSPVVRHRLPIWGAHSHGSFDPHSQMLNTIGRPALASASRNLAYCVGPSSPSELHQSSLTRSEEHTSELQS